MKIISLPFSIPQLSALVLLLFQLSVAIPQYGKYNNQGHHGQGHGRQQQYPAPASVPPPSSPDSSGKQQPQPEVNLEIPPNKCQPGLNILPDGGKFQQDANVRPPPPQLPGGGIQVFPPKDPQKGDVNPIQQESPSSSCPEGSGIYKKTGLCYKFATTTLASGELSPCGSFMEFYKINGSHPPIGECDCKSEHLGVPRPIAYWGKSDQCYWLFDQGPCTAEEWLILNENDEPVCNKRSCPENTLEDWSPSDGNRKYWFRHRGKCYKSDEKGFCENPEFKIYLTVVKYRYTTECKGLDIGPKTLLNGAKPLPCLPGHKESATGECRRTATFE